MIELRFIDNRTVAVDGIGQLKEFGFTPDMLAAPEGDNCMMLFNAEDCTVLVMDIDTYNLWQSQSNNTL